MKWLGNPHASGTRWAAAILVARVTLLLILLSWILVLTLGLLHVMRGDTALLLGIVLGPMIGLSAAACVLLQAIAAARR